MATFPRKGVELSTNCELLFDDARYHRPAIVTEFENGAREARFRTATGTYEFDITFTGDDNDFNVMMAFIETHGNVVTFTLVHPDYGTGTAYIVDETVSIQKVVRGNPRWRRIQLTVRSEH